MHVASWFPDFFKLSADHPLIAAWLALILLLVLLLGGVHVSRIFGNFLVDVVHEIKHELSGLRTVVRRLKDELTTWKADP